MKATVGLPSEFELIARYFAPLAKGFPGVFGLLDDAAVIGAEFGRELVAKTDAIVGVHFFADDPPHLIARKALRVNLSDLAAKGAVPHAYMLALRLPTGTIGDAALGLEFLRGALPDLPEDATSYLVDRFRLPRPRCALGPHPIGIASAAVDVSDGLVADLGHVCEVSCLAAVIDARSLPLSKAARAALVGDSRRIATVLTGGDDYETLFTASPTAVDQVRELSRTHGVPITAIGQMHSAETKERPITIIAGDTEIDNLDRAGWTHC